MTETPQPPRLPPGKILAGRFRIERFVARGGMGEVYEALDLELDEPVALKTIRPELAADAKGMARFKREIQLARKVTHPNVCRTFDLGFHSEGAAGTDCAFLTMELLLGESLGARLREAGPFPIAEALPLVKQMAGALGAAHDAGIVHRDFSTGNVMLVPGVEGLRAVVTDFGLAGSSHTPSAMGDEEDSAGTPAYMAPEQIEGGEITAAADLYALGLVMYEMITGDRPFPGHSTTGVAADLSHKQCPPLKLSALNPRWEPVIRRCLERDPKARFPCAADLIAALAGDEKPQGRARPSLAMLGFRNLSGRPEADWYATAFSEMLATELAAGETLRLIPGENVNRVRGDLALGESDSLAPDTLAQVRTLLGADWVVRGSYLALGEPGRAALRLDVRLQSSRRPDADACFTQSGSETEFFDLIARTGVQLRAGLGVAALSAEQAGTVRAALPANPEALRLYAEGVALLRDYELPAAREKLRAAVAADPVNPLIHAALAQAWDQSGHDDRARAAAQRAVELSAALPREERLWVEARRHEIVRDWDAAIVSYRELTQLFPDELDYALRLASAQSSAGRGGEAMGTLDALRASRPETAGDARVDLEESVAADAIADGPKQLAAARRAAQKAEESGGRLLLAAALWAEGYACYRMGDYARARTAYEEAKAIYLGAGERRGLARAQKRIADLLWSQGDYDGAKRRLYECLQVSRELGDAGGVIRAYNLLAIILDTEGDLAGAKNYFTQVLELSRENRNPNGCATALNNLGENLRKLGDLTAAKNSYAEAHALYRSMNDQRGVARALDGLGYILLQQGELVQAAAKFQEKLALCESTGEKSSGAHALHGLGLVRLATGEFAPARECLERALQLRESLGEKGNHAESRLALARLVLAEGNPEAAAVLAAAAAGEFNLEGRRLDEAGAETIRALALLEAGDSKGARAALRLPLAEAAGCQTRELRWRASLADARVAAAEGNPAAARGCLEQLLLEAAAQGDRVQEFETQLALGNIELAGGEEAQGRRRLSALGRAASAQGFRQIAQAAQTSEAAQRSR